MPKSRIPGVLALLLITLLFSTALAKVPFDEGFLERLTNALSRWNTTARYEKVYLHTDRDIYSVGDTIYFKAYVTGGAKHKLSILSGSVYIDLINEENLVERSIKLPLTIGMAAGTIDLPSILKAGNYRLKAYTEWMRNAGSEYFYDHTFSVVDASSRLKSNITYKTIQADDKKVLTAIIDYKNGDGQPVADKKVDCIIRLGNNKTTKRYTTDTDGRITVEIPENRITAGQHTFLETTLFIDNKETYSRKVIVKAGALVNDVQFFPESGYLLSGFNSRVAFKAIGPDGLGCEVSGRVLDDKSHEIATFNTEHLGMGLFSFIPRADVKYSAEIKYADGSVAIKALPAVNNEGMTMAVYQPNNDSLLVRIYASPSVIAVGKEVALITQKGGELGYAARMVINRPMTSVWIEKKQLLTGVNQLTLFNDKMIALNERLIFVKNNDELKIGIDVVSGSRTTRGKMEIALRVSNSLNEPVIGGFSVSVVPEAINPVPEDSQSTILSTLLLSSDIKGYIEKPNYYFNDKNTNAATHLDHLMLTQGFRRFIWKDILQDTLTKSRYKAEKYTTVSGRLLTLGGKPSPNGKVLLFSPQTTIRDTATDSDGRFSFDVLVPEGVKFNVKGRSEKNSDNVQVVLDKPTIEGPGFNKNFPDMKDAYVKEVQDLMGEKQQERRILQKLGKLNEVQQLAQVDIKAKRKSTSGPLGGFSVPEASADQVYIPDSADNCGNAAMCFQGKLRGIVLSNLNSIPFYPHMITGTGLAPMLLIVDGSRIDSLEAGDLLSTLEITDIAKVMVVGKSIVQMMMATGTGTPLLVIETKRGWARKSNTPSMAFIAPKGYAQMREFYMPKYDKPKDPTYTDTRSTVYWNPDIRTKQNGEGVFSFYNSDKKGVYQVIIEGISSTGQIGRKVITYEVQKL